MINDLSYFHEEIVIANNQTKVKEDVQTLNPKLKVLEAKWVYK